jgi:site-specific DNA recombinase
MTKRAVILARVSKDEQAAKGYSLPSQLEACRKYAEAHDFHVVAEFTDDITGATPIADRPGGKQVQKMIDLRQTDVVICYDVDRFYRDNVELLITIRQWLRAGIEPHFCDIGRVRSENDVLLVIKGWVGSEEREKIRERTKRGKDKKASSGKYVGGGRKPPYGYALSGGELVVNEEEARTVRLIYRLYLEGDDNGESLSMRGIAHKLSTMGIPTPGAVAYSHNRKRGPCMWSADAIYTILTNEIYSGVWRWGKTRWNFGERQRRPDEAAVDVPVPPIVDLAMWQAAQERREYNKRMSKRNNTKHNYLLRGRVRCACGSRMRGKCKDDILYYYCPSNDRRFVDIEGRVCDQKHVRSEMLDSIVWRHVLDIVTDRERFRQLLLEAQRQELDALQPKRERLAHIEGLIAQAESDAAKLARALVNASGGIVGNTLKQQIEDVNTRHSALCAERDALAAQIEAGALTDDQITTMLTMFAQDVTEGLRNATFENKRQALEDLDVRVKVEGNQARVSCRVPVCEGVFCVGYTSA